MRLTAEQLYPLEEDVGRVIRSCTLLNLFLMRKRLSCSTAASVQPDLLRRPAGSKKRMSRGETQTTSLRRSSSLRREDYFVRRFPLI